MSQHIQLEQIKAALNKGKEADAQLVAAIQQIAELKASLVKASTMLKAKESDFLDALK